MKLMEKFRKPIYTRDLPESNFYVHMIYLNRMFFSSMKVYYVKAHGIVTQEKHMVFFYIVYDMF